MGEIRQDRLRRIYEAHADRVMAYCLRHLPPSAAEDAVGDVFLVAWRRIDHVPDDAIGWLLVTAKKDKICDPRTAAAAAKELPNGHFLEVADCGHAPQIENEMPVKRTFFQQADDADFKRDHGL